MPQVAAAAAAAFSYVTAASTAVAAGTATAAQIATTIAVNIAASVAITAATSLLAPQVGRGGEPTEWVADPNAPIHFAAGRIGAAGRIAHKDEYGPDNMFETLVTVLSGAGPIKSFVSFTGDDVSVSFSSEVATTSQLAGEMYMQTRLGTQPETAHTSPAGLKSSATLPGWSSANKLSGQASYMMTLVENSKQSAFGGVEPKPLWTIEGLYGWDPVQDSTYPGGSGACRLNDPATWVYLTNPIRWALKWALGLWEDPIGKGAPQVGYQVGGIGSTLDGIDVAAFVDAANIADANGWTVAAYPSTDDSKSQVLDAFLQAGGAVYAQKAGKISCIHRAAPRTSVVTISAADTAGPIDIDTTASRVNRINTIRPRFWDEDAQWQMNSIDEVTDAAWLAQDGGKRTRGVDFPYVPNKDQCAQLAYLQTANTREPYAGTIPLKPHLQNIKPGDAFTITEPGFVLDGLKCLCLNTEFDAGTGIHKVSFVSDTDAKYDGLALTGTTPTVPTITPVDPTVVTPPGPTEWVVTGETLAGGDGSQVPTLVFTGAVDNDRAQSVIFEYRLNGGTEWQVAGTDSPNVALKEVGLAPGSWEAAVSYRIGENTSDRLVLAPVTLAGSIAGTFVDAGPLAVSALTEAQVQGRYFGEHAGDTAANSAGLQNGDTYVDSSLFPKAFKVKTAGVISEVGNAGRVLTKTTNTQSLAAGATAIYSRTVISNLQAESFVTVSGGFILTYPATRSGTGSVEQPGGTYAIKEKVAGAADGTAKIRKSGAWSTSITGTGSTGIDDLTIDGEDFANGADLATSDISRRWPTGDAASKEWFIEIVNTATGVGGLVNFGAALLIQIERSPPA